MKIFIAGCARSGTGLTRHLMWCFDDTFVFDEHEAGVEKFAELQRPESHVVVKRTAGSYKSLPGLAADIGLLYCIRHPFDTLTSSHPETKHVRRFHVTPGRWSEEYSALLALRKHQPQRQIFFSRYEDLVREPDVTQQRMAGFFGLTPRRRFSENPGSPIVATSLEKWEQDQELLTYLYGLPISFLSLVNRFCTEFDYELPVPAAVHVTTSRG